MSGELRGNPPPSAHKRNHRHGLMEMNAQTHRHTHKNFLEALYYDVWRGMASTYNPILTAICITCYIPGAD